MPLGLNCELSDQVQLARRDRQGFNRHIGSQLERQLGQGGQIGLKRGRGRRAPAGLTEFEHIAIADRQPGLNRNLNAGPGLPFKGQLKGRFKGRFKGLSAVQYRSWVRWGNWPGLNPILSQ